MSLFNIEMDLQTVYRSDFTEKRGSAFKYTLPADSNPVSSPWYEYLVPDESLQHLLPADDTFEEPSCVLHRNHLKHLPDLALVKKQLEHRGQSLYQFDFCRPGDFESKNTRNAKIITFPPNWKTSASTHRCSYRDPKSIMSLPVEPPRFAHKDNLIPNELERKILGVKTGESEYMASCGKLGEFIICEKLHGKGKSEVMSLWEVKRRLALLEQGIIPEN
ncbi:Capsid vertex component 2 [Frankliniella fusca]|uniref:Capsid vertex component 2 n=1 Tax=Frankliniella fusca TaxID=407009 RepID=A0AAE1LXE4_9NEOP|nr:Capsid vertex component 2 [Frankliniella fusca]